MESKEEEESKDTEQLRERAIRYIESEKSKYKSKLLTRHTSRIMLVLSFYEWVTSTFRWILSNDTLSDGDMLFYIFIMFFLMLLPLVIAKFPRSPYSVMIKVLKIPPPYTLSSGVILFIFAQFTDYAKFSYITLIILVLGVVITSDIISMFFRYQINKIEIRRAPTKMPPRVYSVIMQIALIIFILLATVHVFYNIELWRFIVIIIMTVIIYWTLSGVYIMDWILSKGIEEGKIPVDDGLLIDSSAIEMVYLSMLSEYDRNKKDHFKKEAEEVDKL